MVSEVKYFVKGSWFYGYCGYNATNIVKAVHKTLLDKIIGEFAKKVLTKSLNKVLKVDYKMAIPNSTIPNPPMKWDSGNIEESWKKFLQHAEVLHL